MSFSFFHNQAISLHNRTSPLSKVHSPLLNQQGVAIDILRCDLIHPDLSGNKWFKLKYNLREAEKLNSRTLLSFGGAWSNHIHALSAAGKLFGFKTIGVIRGENKGELTECLSDAVNNGMHLHWVSREQYRDKTSENFITDLKALLGDFYLIPEGGSNFLGIKGCQEIVSPELAKEYDLICLACGTGTTLSGIISNTGIPVLGFQVLKGEGYLAKDVRRLLLQHALPEKSTWSINDEYHFGGYAKTTPELMHFITEFEAHNKIPLEPIYSGKMLYGIYDLAAQGYFSKGSRVLVIHGGGLQGKRGKS